MHPPHQNVSKTRTQNNASRFYRVISNADLEDLRERQQEILEAIFKDKNDEVSYLFNEVEFDNIMKLTETVPPVEPIVSKAAPKIELDESYIISREDLDLNEENSQFNVSNFTEKGSAKTVSNNGEQAGKSKSSNHWNRIDIRQK